MNIFSSFNELAAANSIPNEHYFPLSIYNMSQGISSLPEIPPIEKTEGEYQINAEFKNGRYWAMATLIRYPKKDFGPKPLLGLTPPTSEEVYKLNTKSFSSVLELNKYLNVERLRPENQHWNPGKPINIQ